MGISETVKQGWSTRRAWWFTATARTRERFERTALGSFWLGLSNLLSIGVLGVVYGSVFKVKDFGHYFVYLGLGLVTWNAIAGAIQSAPYILRSNAAKIKGYNTHPIFYTLEEWAFQLQTFGQSFVLVIIVLTFFNHSLAFHLLTAGILPLINLIIFIYWLPLIICVLGSEFEDLYQMIPIILQLMFLLSPILYQKSSLGKMAWTADINPIYRILSNLRQALIDGHLRFEQVIVVFGLNILGLVVSLALFSKHQKKLPFII